MVLLGNFAIVAQMFQAKQTHKGRKCLGVESTFSEVGSPPFCADEGKIEPV
jgi:hypothetical protein